MNKKKTQSNKPSDLIPKGIKQSIVPQSFLDAVKQVNWDYQNPLHANIIILQNQ